MRILSKQAFIIHFLCHIFVSQPPDIPTDVCKEEKSLLDKVRTPRVTFVNSHTNGEDPITNREEQI